MDGIRTSGFEDAGSFAGQPSNISSPNVATQVSKQATGSSRRRAWCWQHMDQSIEMENGNKVVYAICKYCGNRFSASSTNGTGHIKRHAEKCMAKFAEGRSEGAAHTQLNYGPDGSVSTWMYDPKVPQNEIARYIYSENLPLGMGKSPKFERMIKRGFGPQYQHVSKEKLLRET